MKRAILFILAACKHDAPPPPPAADAAIDAGKPVDAGAAPIDAAQVKTAFATKLAAGAESFCAVMSDRTVRCWGENRHGQLGGEGAGTITPAIRNVVDVVMSDDTACAQLDDHSVACWGEIAWQPEQKDSTTLRPTGVLGVIGVKQVFVGSRRACARVEDGTLVCWGDVDAKGHVTTDGRRRQPTPVVGLDKVIAMRPTAALRDDGSLFVWGEDGEPTRVAVAGATELGERNGTICVRTPDDVRCIGPAATCTSCPSGQKCTTCTTKNCTGCPASPTCGVAAEPPKPVDDKKAPLPKKPPPPPKKPPPKKPPPKKPPDPPAPPPIPPGLPTASLALPAGSLAIEAGWCAITAKHELACNQLCDDKLTGFELGSSSAARKFKVVQVAGHCARLFDGSVECWDGSQIAKVEGVTHASAIVAASTRTCALLDDGAVWCWGANRLASQIL